MLQNAAKGEENLGPEVKERLFEKKTDTRAPCCWTLCEESNCEGNDEGWRQVLTQSSAGAGGSVMGSAVWFSVHPEGDHLMQKHLG